MWNKRNCKKKREELEKKDNNRRNGGPRCQAFILFSHSIPSIRRRRKKAASRMVSPFYFAWKRGAKSGDEESPSWERKMAIITIWYVLLVWVLVSCLGSLSPRGWLVMFSLIFCTHTHKCTCSLRTDVYVHISYSRSLPNEVCMSPILRSLYHTSFHSFRCEALVSLFIYW